MTGERVNDYGTPENNFNLIGNMWTAYLGYPVTAKDVAVMMILMKSARLANGGGSGDSWVDIAGYAACGSEITRKEN